MININTIERLFENDIQKCKIITKKGTPVIVLYDRYYVRDFIANIDDILSIFITSDKLKGGNSKSLTRLQNSLKTPYISRGKKSRALIELHCGFDIETTRINEHLSFCYGWQFSINDIVIWGDDLKQFVDILDILKDTLQGKKSHRLIVWVANLGYEWQFIKHYLTVTKAFLKEIREPMEIEHNDFVIFKECLSWGGSLNKLAEDYTDIIKLKGDLDFSVYRENYREFKTRKEWQYIDFDVLTLSHFGVWYFNQYVNATHTKPVTIQSAIRNNLYTASTEYDRENITKWSMKDAEDYKTLVNNVYRGGYCHANKTMIGKEIKGLWSYDFTSSYPSVMLCRKYPTKFSRVLDKKKYNFDYIMRQDFNNRAYIIHVVLFNVKSTTNHSIESKSKAINKIMVSDNDTIIDNGRICECPLLDTWICEQDLLSYMEFYTWERAIIEDLWSAPKEYLPRYIIDELTRLYITKDTLKKQHKNYAIEKSYLNSLYGVLISRLVVGECLVDEDNNVYCDLDGLTDEEKAERYIDAYIKDLDRDKRVLLAHWGVYVSAYARRNLLDTLFKLETDGNPTAYMDTDSIKFLDLNNGKKIIEEYNNKQQNIIHKMCIKYGLDYNIFYDLGSFDCEYKNGIKLFKTLGAKRYLHVYEEDDVLHYQCTVAGLPKKDYISRYKPENDKDYISYFEPFKDSLTIEKTSKLTSCYEDEPQQFTGRTYYKNQTVYVPSCITLNDCPFSMGLDTNWCNYLISLGISKFAQRNYG